MLKTVKELLKGNSQAVVAAGSMEQVQTFNEKINTAYDLIDMVFAEIKGCKPASHLTFKDPDAETVAKRQWVLALVESGINTLDYINRGLTMARQDKSPYFPSIGQFIDWCKNMNIADNLPTVNEAYLEAAQKSHNPYKLEFSHDIVFLAGKLTGWRYLLENTQKDALPVFKRNYDVLMRKLANNEPLVVDLGIEDKNGDDKPKKPYVKNYGLAASTLAAMRDIVG